MSTEGYLDQLGGKHTEKFKVKRFKNLILSMTEKPAKEQNEIIKMTFCNRRQNIE